MTFYLLYRRQRLKSFVEKLWSYSHFDQTLKVTLRAKAWDVMFGVCVVNDSAITTSFSSFSVKLSVLIYFLLVNVSLLRWPTWIWLTPEINLLEMYIDIFLKASLKSVKWFLTYFADSKLQYYSICWHFKQTFYALKNNLVCVVNPCATTKSFLGTVCIKLTEI